VIELKRTLLARCGIHGILPFKHSSTTNTLAFCLQLDILSSMFGINNSDLLFTLPEIKRLSFHLSINIYMMEFQVKEKATPSRRQRSNTIQSASPRRPTLQPPRKQTGLPSFGRSVKLPYGAGPGAGPVVEEWADGMLTADTTSAEEEGKRVEAKNT
jgi:hypothetical protein